MKENQNSLDYNVWSAGEYENNLDGIQYIGTAITAKTTTEYSVIGENSINLQTNDSSGFVMITRGDYNQGTILTGKAHIRCRKGSVRFRIDDGASNIIASTTINENTVDNITISGTVPITGNWRLQLVVSANTELYIDNITFN